MATNKQIIEKINAAFDNNDTEAFLDYCTEDFTWTMVGDTSFKGKDAVRNFLNAMPSTPPAFTVKEVIGEDDSVVCYGDLKMKNKEGESDDYSFCDVYHFTNGKAAELLTFMTRHKKPSVNQ